MIDHEGAPYDEGESPRWEGPEGERCMTLEQYLWERVQRAEEAVKRLNKENYRLNKRLAELTVGDSLLPPPIGGA